MSQRAAATQIPTPHVSQSWDNLRSEWRAGVRSRHRPTPNGMPHGAASGDWHYQNEHEFLRAIELIRHYERNDPVVNAALSRLTANVCQNGFTVDPQTDDEAVNQRLLEEWRAWSNDPRACDRRGRQTFQQMMELIFRSVVRDGDCCIVPLSSGALKIYEAHRLRTPTGTTRNVVHGILMDEHRRPREYWFTKEPIEPLHAVELVGDMDRIIAYDASGWPLVHHVARPLRESQARGVPWLAPSVDWTEMRHNIDFAKMVQQQTVSCYSLMVKRSAAFRPEDDDAREAGRDKSRDEYLERLATPLADLTPGMIYDPLPGEELVGFSPNVPNAEYFDHATMLLTYFSINLDLPLAVLMLDPRQTNFSGWRGAIDQARISWRKMQRWLIEQAHAPIYRWWVRNKLAREPWLQDALRGGADIYAHEWKAPAWAYIEPLKDVQADRLARETGMATRRKQMALKGDSYDEEMPAIFAELEAELMACVAITDRVNREMVGKEAGRLLDLREVAMARGILPNPMMTTLSGALEDSDASGQPDANGQPDA